MNKTAISNALSICFKKVLGFGLPRIIIIVFLIAMFTAAHFNGMPILDFFGDVLRRWGMWGILVLAMVPAIQGGIGPNFGISVGIAPGLVGAVLSMELRHRGYFEAFADNPAMFAVVGAFTAIIIGVIFAIGTGMLYGLLMNRVKGSEMAVSVYVGLSTVAVFNILWATIPVTNPVLILPATGRGLRQMLNLRDDFGGAFDNILQFRFPWWESGQAWVTQRGLGIMTVNTGLLILFFIMCFLMYLFTKSRTGMRMAAAGSNPEYARASGINVDKMRILGTTISTALGAFGIVVYAQSFGFMQMYTAPLMMGFTAVASVLIGGASVKRAKVSDVLLGALLFNAILVIALPLANNLLPGYPGLPEILRITISYGIILYSLTTTKEVR